MYLEFKATYTSSLRPNDATRCAYTQIPILRYNSQVYLLCEVFHQGKKGMDDSKKLIRISRATVPILRIVAVSGCVCLIPLALFEVEFKVLV